MCYAGDATWVVRCRRSMQQHTSTFHSMEQSAAMQHSPFSNFLGEEVGNDVPAKWLQDTYSRQE